MSDKDTQFTDLTPYVAAQVATRVLRNLGVIPEEAEIAPQTMYGNKTIERYGTPRREGGNGIYFVGASFAKWLDGMKRGESGGGRIAVDVDALVAEYGQEDVAEASATDEPDTAEEPGDDAGTEAGEDGGDLEQQLQASLDRSREEFEAAVAGSDAPEAE